MSEPMSLHSLENMFRCCLKALLPFLREFVYSHLQRCYGPRYKERLVRQPTDASAFLGIAIEHWGAAFRAHAPAEVKNHLFTIKEVRNRWAHDENVSDEEYRHAISAIRLLAKKIGGDKAIAAIDDCSPPPGKECVCPACKTKIFKRCPWGWDAHAAYKCSGLTETDPEARKNEFRMRFPDFFRRD